MRKGTWLLVAIITLTATSQSQAQFGLFGGNQNNTGQQPVMNTRVNSSTFVGSTFRLRDLFPAFNPFSNRNSVGRSNVADPNTEDYLKQFGYKRLY